jgi:hypothetical protein
MPRTNILFWFRSIPLSPFIIPIFMANPLKYAAGLYSQRQLTEPLERRVSAHAGNYPFRKEKNCKHYQ